MRNGGDRSYRLVNGGLEYGAWVKTRIHLCMHNDWEWYPDAFIPGTTSSLPELVNAIRGFPVLNPSSKWEKYESLICIYWIVYVANPMQLINDKFGI